MITPNFIIKYQSTMHLQLMDVCGEGVGCIHEMCMICYLVQVHVGKECLHTSSNAIISPKEYQQWILRQILGQISLVHIIVPFIA